jgi:hypothetical protein
LLGQGPAVAASEQSNLKHGKYARQDKLIVNVRSEKNVIFCTLARKEQLAAAVILAKSVKTHHPEVKMVVCLADHHLSAEHAGHFDEVVIVTNHGAPFDTAESSCAAKAYFLKHLNECYPEDKLIYLDPETNIYGAFHDIEHMLDEHPIIAVPYHLESCDEDDYLWEIERLHKGFLHAGFLALRGSDISRHFLQWWSRHMDTSFYGPYKDGVADHKWLSRGMVPFSIHQLKDPSYHVAAWNVHAAGRRLSFSPEGGYLVNGRPLHSFLFANPDGLLDSKVHAFIPDRSNPVYTLLHTYKGELKRIRQSVS